MTEKDPLLQLLELKIKALKSKAHPSIIANIDKQISNEAKAVITLWQKSDLHFAVFLIL